MYEKLQKLTTSSPDISNTDRVTTNDNPVTDRINDISRKNPSTKEMKSLIDKKTALNNVPEDSITENDRLVEYKSNVKFETSNSKSITTSTLTNFIGESSIFSSSNLGSPLLALQIALRKKMQFLEFLEQANKETGNENQMIGETLHMEFVFIEKSQENAERLLRFFTDTVNAKDVNSLKMLCKCSEQGLKPQNSDCVCTPPGLKIRPKSDLDKMLYILNKSTHDGGPVEVINSPLVLAQIHLLKGSFDARIKDVIDALQEEQSDKSLHDSGAVTGARSDLIRNDSNYEVFSFIDPYGYDGIQMQCLFDLLTGRTLEESLANNLTSNTNHSREVPLGSTNKPMVSQAPQTKREAKNNNRLLLYFATETIKSTVKEALKYCSQRINTNTIRSTFVSLQEEPCKVEDCTATGTGAASEKIKNIETSRKRSTDWGLSRKVLRRVNAFFGVEEHHDVAEPNSSKSCNSVELGLSNLINFIKASLSDLDKTTLKTSEGRAAQIEMSNAIVEHYIDTFKTKLIRDRRIKATASSIELRNGKSHILTFLIAES